MENPDVVNNSSSETMDVDPKILSDRGLSDSWSGGDDDGDGRPVERSDEEGVCTGSDQLDDSGAKDQNGDEDVKSRKKHRRGKNKGGSRHNKKWRPYNKLSWSERKELDERETQRACLKREERFASGHPVAPYNTTQFLMEDHSKNENISPFLHDRPNLSDPVDKTSREPGNVDSNDAYYDSPNDEESFIAKDFTETYENIHAERLQTMTKTELVKDYIELEAKVEKLEGRLRESPETKDMNNITVNKEVKKLVDSTNTPSETRLRHLLQQEIERLKLENERLRNENQQLRGGTLT